MNLNKYQKCMAMLYDAKIEGVSYNYNTGEYTENGITEIIPIADIVKNVKLVEIVDDKIQLNIYNKKSILKIGKIELSDAEEVLQFLLNGVESEKFCKDPYPYIISYRMIFNKGMESEFRLDTISQNEAKELGRHIEVVYKEYKGM